MRPVGIGGSGAIALAIALSACAEVGRPSGGPADTVPPALTAAAPGSLQTRVDPRTPLRLTFTEEVDRRRVARAVTVVPAVPMEPPRFEGLEVEFRPSRDWPADTVVVWTLGPDLADKHGVRLGTEVRGAFTTGEGFPSGAIRGSASLAIAPPKPPDWSKLRAELDLPAPEGVRRRPRWRSAQGDQQGNFELTWIDVPSGPYHLTVYLDANANAKRDEREPVAELDSLFLAQGDSILVLTSERLRLVDREGPVDVRFCIESALGDSLRVQLWVQGEEETRARKAAVDSSGCVTLSLPVGRVAYGAWVDDGDQKFGADSTGISEAFTPSDTLVVQPAQPDTLRVPWPDRRMRQTEIDSLRTPPVPKDLSTDSPRRP